MLDTENPYITIAAILAIVGSGLRYFLINRDKKLENAVSHKEFLEFKRNLRDKEALEKSHQVEIEERKIEERNLREDGLKVWVGGKIAEAINRLTSIFQESIAKLDTKIEDIRKEGVTRHDTIIDLFQRYKKDNHGRIEQMEATVAACMETLKRAEHLDDTVDKSRELVNDLRILVRNIKQGNAV